MLMRGESWRKLGGGVFGGWLSSGTVVVPVM